MVRNLGRPVMWLEDHVALAQLLNEEYANQPTEVVIEALQYDERIGRTAIVSSFGADSAVLLHMVSQINSRAAIIFIDTGFHFSETLTYRDHVVERFGLENVWSVTIDPLTTKREDRWGQLHRTEPDRCCELRKVEVLNRALEPFGAWCSGQKQHQSESRRSIELFEVDVERRKLKVNPLAFWSSQAVLEYARSHRLPSHPLVEQGYPSIGCAPCTGSISAGEALRAGRWRGLKKNECGLHAPSAVFFKGGSAA